MLPRHCNGSLHSSDGALPTTSTSSPTTTASTAPPAPPLVAPFTSFPQCLPRHRRRKPPRPRLPDVFTLDPPVRCGICAASPSRKWNGGLHHRRSHVAAAHVRRPNDGAANVMDRLQCRNTHDLREGRPSNPPSTSRPLQELEPSSPGLCLTPTVSCFLFMNLHSFLSL
jgi:hypothetical protein